MTVVTKNVSIKGIAYINNGGVQPDHATREAMSKALQYCFPGARTWGPIVSPDTSVLPIDPGACRSYLGAHVADLITNGWAVFLADEDIVCPAVRTLPGMFAFRTRNGLTEIHRRLPGGKTDKVFPRI